MSALRLTLYKQLNYFSLFVLMALVLSILFLTIIFMLLFCYKMRKKNLSYTLRIYQFVWLLYVLSTFLLYGFRALDCFNFSDFIVRNVMFDCILGSVYFTFLLVVPYSTCLLIVDRILAIKNLDFKKYQYLYVVFLILMFWIYFFYNFYNTLYPTKTLDWVEYCGFSCRIYYSTYDLHLIKSCVGLVNIFMGVLFAFFFFKYLNQHSRHENRNRTVICIILTELLFNSIPSLLYFSIQTNDAVILDFNPRDLLIIVSSFEGLITTLSYWFSYQRTHTVIPLNNSRSRSFRQIVQKPLTLFTNFGSSS